jgi:CheY-like chemotaxis protein
MNAILGINDLIIKESKEEKIRSYALDMKNSGDALLTIINDVLDISKIEAGKMDIRNNSYNLAELVDELTFEAQQKAKTKHIDFEVNLDESLPYGLVGDKEHLSQVLRNVLDNAIKFTRRGVVKFKVAGDVHGDILHLVFESKDTGIGIREEDQEKIFSNFGRVDMEKNRSIEGTGLGLSLSQKIMNLLNGNISVKSEYGIGSTFTVELDQYIEEFESIENYRKTHGNYNPMTQKINVAERKRFLVVDDNEMNIRVARAFLENSGAEIATETDSVAAFARIQKEKFDIIFLDDLMPRLTGPTILTRVRRGEGVNKDTPMIIMTANATESDRLEYLSKGFDGFVGKPIKEEKLIAEVNNFIVS